ncbi:ABC transporter permease [Moheibacter stercoris]|uniref:ABC-2 type transport system permease protein n=1 Tax=Moheibacter stercoris TaxID=1628251 RepID=A0ABV2LRS5_9FLAO
MKQILLVAQREFFTQVKNKTFLIMTVLTPLFMVGIFAIIAWMMSANSDQKTIAVVDESKEFITALVSNENNIYNFYPAKDIQGIKDTLLGSKYLDGILVIPKLEGNDFNSLDKKIELTTNGNIGNNYTSQLEDKINTRIEELKLEKEGISHEKMGQLKSNISIKSFDLKGGKENRSEYVKFGFAMALSYIIFMFIMIYGVKVMRSIVEEKNNRVVEIIISSVKPFNLMMGKILGTTFVALTQFTIWIIMGIACFVGATAFLGSKMDEFKNVQTPQTEILMQQQPEWLEKSQTIVDGFSDMNFPVIIFLFLLYFFIGYLFYSSIFAAIGSAVENDTDTQQFTFYPIFPLMIAMYGSMTTLDNPDGPVAFWLSMIPFTSPISMVTRIPFGVEWWEIALSLGLLIGTMLMMVYFASKVYRVGILMYGKKPSFKEMWKWMRYSN